MGVSAVVKASFDYLGLTRSVFGSFVSVERAVASIVQAPSKLRFLLARLFLVIHAMLLRERKRTH